MGSVGRGSAEFICKELKHNSYFSSNNLSIFFSLLLLSNLHEFNKIEKTRKSVCDGAAVL